MDFFYLFFVLRQKDKQKTVSQSVILILETSVVYKTVIDVVRVRLYQDYRNFLWKIHCLFTLYISSVLWYTIREGRWSALEERPPLLYYRKWTGECIVLVLWNKYFKSILQNRNDHNFFSLKNNQLLLMKMCEWVWIYIYTLYIHSSMNVIS